MHTSALLAVSGFAAAVTAGTLSVPITKQFRARDAPAAAAAAVRRRDDSFNMEVLNNLTGKAYFTELGIGTPPQNLTFLVDTGSSDTWVNSNQADFCTKGQTFLGQTIPPSCLPQFDPKNSDTYKLVSQNFEIQYLDGSAAQGEYFNDTVTIGNDATIKSQQLGLADVTTHPTGIMGLGMSVAVASNKKYPTIVDNLVSHGIIDTPAFSLYLDSVSQDKGSILFGGIDTKKYVGNLALLPLKPDTLSGFENVTSYSVDLKGFTVDGGIDVPANVSTGAIFDTGSTISLMPESVVKPIWDKFKIATVLQMPTPFIDCKYAGKKYNKYKFNFQFDGVNITVPLKALVVDSLDSDVQSELKSNFLTESDFKGFDKICMFGIGNGGSFVQSDSSSEAPKFALLGDTFLRSAYVVYDLANQQLGLAPAYLNSDDSNVVALKANSTLPVIKGMDGKSCSL